MEEGEGRREAVASVMRVVGLPCPCVLFPGSWAELLLLELLGLLALLLLL